MKRTTKRWLLAAASLVLIGILVFGGAMTANRWDFAALSTVKFKTETCTVSESFHSISIRSDTEDILFVPAGDGKSRVEFYEDEKTAHTAAVRDGTLVIDTAETGKWYDRFPALSWESPGITVYLPGSAYVSLLVEEDTGSIVIPEDFTFDSIDIAAGTGNVECRASASGPVRIELTTGGIRVENISAGALELITSTGDVNVHTVECAGRAETAVSTGKTVWTDVVCGSFSSTGSTGDVALENVLAADKITVERGTGDVRLTACDAAGLFVRTDTGDVTGTLLSEKVFIAQSDTGRVDVPKTVSGGQCEIVTDTGDIILTIE